jgi:hypothetical protein
VAVEAEVAVAAAPTMATLESHKREHMLTKKLLLIGRQNLIKQ